MGCPSSEGSTPLAITPTSAAGNELSLEDAWPPASAYLAAMTACLGQAEPSRADWEYLNSICAMCRRENQPWQIVLHSLHVPWLLGRAISTMLEVDFLQDPIHQQLIAVVMATANLLSTACQDPGLEGQHLQVSDMLCQQVAQSGMLAKVPAVMSDIAEALAAGSNGGATDQDTALMLLALPFLQLFMDLSSAWPGETTKQDAGSIAEAQTVCFAAGQQHLLILIM